MLLKLPTIHISSLKFLNINVLNFFLNTKFFETFKFRKCWPVLGIDTFLAFFEFFLFCETELNENETKDSEATGIEFRIHA